MISKAWMSRSAGHVARTPASRWLIPWFARHYGIDRAAAVVPPGGFTSLQQFFCRELTPGLRPIASAVDLLTSPADATLGMCGTIAAGQLWQAKGSAYSLEALLASPEAAPRYVGGCYCTLYLAPSDYHRVHAPAAGEVREARFVPGDFWPVHPRAVASIPGLFTRNERVVTFLDTAVGQLAVVMVGACLVGGIRMNYDPAWNAGPGPHRASQRYYQPAARFGRGQELGRFEFGSTVIVLTEAAMQASLAAAPGTHLQYGQPLLHLRGTA